MARSRRVSVHTAAVVLELAEDPTAWHYGYALCQRLRLKAGSLYPILIRLVDQGMVEAAWEPDPPAGRPPRHRYRLTGAGQAFATRVAAEARRTPGPHLRMELAG